jgi:transposase
MPDPRKSYPTDVSDEQWAFCAPYLTLMRDDAPQRAYPLREIFNAVLWIVRAGCPWRLLPTNLSAVTQSAPPAIEISGFKVHHFLGLKTALFERRKAARMGRVQLPESEFTNNGQKPLRAGMVVSPDCARTGD